MGFCCWILWLGTAPIVAILLPPVLLVVLRLVRPVSTNTVAFFHPYCDAGGGGERVLWCAIRAMQQRLPRAEFFVYTGDKAAAEDILKRVQDRFGISLPRPVSFIRLRTRWIVEAERYPRFTMLLQSLGSMILGLEALFRFTPFVFIDSMGYAFVYPLARYLARCVVVTYTHYPTISEDMMQKVQQMRPDYNNESAISASMRLTRSKMIYYRYFAQMYRTMGRCADIIMVNSSWTRRHIVSMWGLAKPPPSVVFPPCDTRKLKLLTLDRGGQGVADGKKHIISIAQFRPEKDHALQLRSIAEYVKKYNDRNIVLHLIGGCRDAGDEQRQHRLVDLAKDLGISDNVQFHVNAAYSEMVSLMQSCSLGLHSMWNEHFGISIVELMAAGVVPIAHNSGGPRTDIIQHGINGYLASTPVEYAEFIHTFFSKLSSDDRRRMQIRGREEADRFSEEAFDRLWLAAMSPVLSKVK